MKKEKEEETKKETNKKEVRVYTGEELANLKSGESNLLDAEITYVVSGGLNLKREGVTAVKLSDLLDILK